MVNPEPDKRLVRHVRTDEGTALPVTEPTWKDPLLQRWGEGCSNETRQYIEGEESSGVLTVLELLDGSSMMTIFADRLRLRSLIDAELARGRVAKARAAAIIAEYAPAIEPESYDDGRIDAAREILEAFGGE